MDLDDLNLLESLSDQFNKWRKEKEESSPVDWLENAAQKWGISAAMVRWLALVPSWTVGLAAYCRIDQPEGTTTPLNDALLFEADNSVLLEQMTETLYGLIKAGLLNGQLMPVVLPPLLRDGRVHRRMVYQMNEQDRQEVLKYLRDKEGQSGVVQRLVACAGWIWNARETIQLPENLTVWAQLVRRVSVPTELVNMVEEAVEQATPIALITLEEEKPKALQPEQVQSRIFAISNQPSPAINLPSAYFTCTEYDSDGKVRRVWSAPITQSPFSIGRTMRNALVLNDRRVSRNHAQVEWRGDSYYIKDNNSSNGIFRFNGKPIPAGEYEPLEDGEELDIGGAGSFRLTFHLSKLEEPAAAPAAPLPQIPADAPTQTIPIDEEKQITGPRTLANPGTWGNPVQSNLDDSFETVHLPTLEANLNQALQWVETARTLQEHLDPPARVRLDRASARLQLQFRRWDDLVQLRTFLERREQIAAFEALINGPDDSYGLHYLGPGGYGKTTLIRYLVTRQAPAHGLPVARIDFDHLDPHYPRYQPGLLLAELAEELRLQAAQAYTFSAFDQSLTSFYEKYPPADFGPGRSESPDWINDPLFKKVLADFAAALKEMGGRVLLVLDTCEELTKVRLAGQPAENVTITLDLLEKLHELEPRLRVIFCGRRPLASAGNGWRYVGSREQPPETVSAADFQPPVVRLAPRPFLALFPVTGFSREETETYLEAAGIEKTFWNPIIEKTLAAPPSLFNQFEWNPTGLLSPNTVRPPRGRKAARSNPFDVSLYANWVREDPDVTPQKVAETDLQRYVETRILGRAQTELSQEFLMAIALLGRFDYALLKATVGGGVEATPGSGQFGAFDNFDAAFQALSAYEWVIHSGNGWLEIQDTILNHLRQYFQRDGEDSGSRWKRLRSQALAHLEERTMNEARLGGSIAAAEVALLLYTQHSHSEAFEWFSRLSRAVVSWDWAQLATERLLGVALERTPASLLLQARILVLQGAARLHQFGPGGLRELWQRINQYVDEAEAGAGKAAPDSYEQSPAFKIRLEFVRVMALAGEAAASFSGGFALPEKRWQAFWAAAAALNPTLPRETGAFLSAIEAAVEARENEQLARPLPIEALDKVYRRLNNRNWLWNNSGAQPRLLAAFARMLLGRALFYEGQPKEGLEHLEAAARSMGSGVRGLGLGEARNPVPRPPAPNPHLDRDWTYLWDAPDDIPARLQLEWGRVARGRLSLALVESHLPLPAKITLPDSLDLDRLTGLQLALSEDLRPAPDARLQELVGLLTDPPTYTLTAEANAHRTLLPARVTAAKALSGVGYFGEAITQLDAFITAAEERGETLASLPETQVLAELATASRLGPNPVRRYGELLRSTEPESLKWVWALEGLEGRRQPQISPWKYPVCLPVHAHYRWRGGYALRREYALNLVQVYNEMAEMARRAAPLKSPLNQARYESDLYQLKLDDRESQLLLQRWGKLPANASIFDPGPPEFGYKENETVLRLTHLLLAEARYQALTMTEPRDEISILSSLTERLGTRQAARLLLQDGELMALRLPRRATYLLSAARSLFQSNREDDPLSAAYAGICETQSLIRAGRFDRARVVWGEIEQSYEKFRRHWPNLGQTLNIPEWHSLERAYTNPQDTEFVLSLFEKLDKQWQPWLARLIFTGVALSEDSEKFLNLRRTLNPVVYASAEKENGLNLLPAELDGLLEEDTTGSTASATNKRTIPSFRMPSPIIKPKLDKLEIVFSGTPGTYPLLTDDPISVRLRDSGRSDSGNVPFLITHRPWREVRYIQGDPAQEQIAERKVPVTWRRAFEGALPGGQLKRSRSVPVVLEVQEGLSFLPWEALTVGNVAIPLQQGVLTRRITKNWSQEPRQTAAPLALLACDPSLDELRKLFDPLREKNLLNEVVRLDLEALGNPEALRRLSGPPGIVQLVGSGRIVNETPRLLLGQRRPAYISDSNPAIPQIKAAPNITPAYTITSLPGRDIARLFPSARLVILQGQPVDNPNWTRDCGAQAAYLRAIAEDVFKAGVPAVLTVPPMTIADGERFGANLLRRLAEVDWQRSGDNGIVEAVSEARRELARQREQTVRSALDVCLYADIGPRSVLFEDKKVL